MYSKVALPPGFDVRADRGPVVLITSGTAIGLAILCILLRFVSRLITKVPLLLDDWLIVAALPTALATSAIPMWGVNNDHFGQHFLNGGSEDSLEHFFRGLYGFQITYTLTNAIAKFSMLALYRRIFPGPNLKIPLIVTAAVTAGYTIAVMLAGIFSCSPISGFWMQFSDVKPKCINSLAYYISSASVNIILDIVLLGLPVLVISRLQITISQKIAVCAIFALGIFVTICSALRLRSLVAETNMGLNADPTWDLVPSAVFGSLEVNGAIICACLPSLRPLLRLLLHGNLSGRFTSRRSGASPSTNVDRSANRFSGSRRAWFGSTDNSEKDRPWAVVPEEQELVTRPAVRGRQGSAAAPANGDLWVRHDVRVSTGPSLGQLKEGESGRSVVQVSARQSPMGPQRGVDSVNERQREMGRYDYPQSSMVKDLESGTVCL